MMKDRQSVLVVEDEILIRLALVDLLEDEGFQVYEASNVLEAVAILGQAEAIDAVITDVDMPGALNGFDLMRLVASCYSQSLVIVTSGAHRPSASELAEGCHFVEKPYRSQTLLDLLDRHIEGSCEGGKRNFNERLRA
ncbi:response regulator [Rhizobium helianthi]|uniref:Response regulator n=1 Tax=Rhizobium helianthi TaxID=1132695 RepID=A0ABW4M2B8_9HYPH